MCHHAPACAVRRNTLGSPQHTIEFARGIRSRELLPGLPLEVAGRDAGGNRAAHFQLRLEIGARPHRAAAGNDAGVRSALAYEQPQTCNHSADPTARRIIDDRICTSRDDVAAYENVMGRHVYINVPVRMGLWQQAVLDRAGADFEPLRVIEKGSARQRRRRAARIRPALPLGGDLSVQPQFRVLVSNDRCASAGERFVGAGVIPVPVRVE